MRSRLATLPVPRRAHPAALPDANTDLARKACGGCYTLVQAAATEDAPLRSQAADAPDRPADLGSSHPRNPLDARATGDELGRLSGGGLALFQARTSDKGTPG